MEEVTRLLNVCISLQEKNAREMKELKEYLSEKFWDIQQRIPTEEEKKARANQIMNDISSGRKSPDEV